MGSLDLHAAAATLMQQWNIRQFVIDRTGLGEGLAALLTQRFGEERIVASQHYHQCDIGRIVEGVEGSSKALVEGSPVHMAGESLVTRLRCFHTLGGSA